MHRARFWRASSRSIALCSG